MVKGKFEYFNGEMRMRYFAVKVFPHNVQAENRALLRRLDIYRAIILWKWLQLQRQIIRREQDKERYENDWSPSGISHGQASYPAL